MTRRERTLWGLAAMPALLLILIPLLALAGKTGPGDLLKSLQQKETLEAIALSLRTTLFAVLAVALLGLPLAYYSGRSKSRFAALIDVVSDLPIVLPPAAAGIALLLVFGREGWLGGPLDKLGIQVTFTSIAVVIAQAFVALPYFVRSAAEGFRQVDPDEWAAAALDGANPFQIALKVILPQARGAVLAGVLMAWARALGEFGATLMFAGNFVGRTQTIPLAIYAGFESDLNQAVTLSIVLLLLAVTVLLAARLLVRAGS